MAKIMHINCACTGSTGKIIGDIADNTAAKECEHILCAPCAPGTNPNIRYFRTSFPHEQGLYKRLNWLYGFQYGFAPFSTIRIKRVIKKERPDLIHMHCANGFMVNVYSLLRYIKRQKIPVVITNHAEFYYTGGCPHAYDCGGWLTGCGNCPQKTVSTGGKLWDTSAIAWRRMKAAFGGLERAVMVSVSPWVRGRAERSPITAGLSHRTVLNGVNTDIFTWQDPAALKEKYGFPAEKRIIFHPTAHFSDSPRDGKGGLYIMELARHIKDPDVVFLVAGRHTPNLEIPENMILLGQISDQRKLAEYYAMADVTVVTGKRETFNMPVAESLCCGTPVAGFMAGGPESVAMECYSRFVEFGDVEALLTNILDLQERPYDKREMAEKAKERYESSVMADGYLCVYRELLGLTDDQLVFAERDS